MQHRLLVLFPGGLNNRKLRQTHHLLDHIDFDKSVGALRLRVERVDLISVHPIGVFEMHQPFIEQLQIGTLSVERGANAAAIVMAADDNMRNFEHLHGVLDDAETVEVRQIT